MKSIRILGIITMLLLVLMVIAMALLVVFGVIKISPKEDGTGNEIIFSPIAEKSNFRIPADAKNTAVIKTELGDITLRLSESSASEEFIALDNFASFDGAEFSVAADNMFIQSNISASAFSVEKTGFACIGGAVGFIMNEEEVTPSFVIITNKELSGLSKAYIKEQAFDEEKAALYNDFGGMPEYEEKLNIFAEVISGFDVIEKIAAKNNSGYTGGYVIEEPVKILSVEIIYPTETTE